MATRAANASPLVDEGGVAAAVVVLAVVEEALEEPLLAGEGAPQPGNPLATGTAEFGTEVAAGGGGAAPVG